MFGLLHIFTIISYYFYSTAYISLKRNQIKKGKEQNTWCNRNQSFLQCSCVENGERRNYPQCNMISPTMHTRWHSVCVCVCVCGLCQILIWGGYSEAHLYSVKNWGGILKLSELDCLSNFTFGGGGILNFRIGVFCRIWTKISTTPAGSCITDSLSHTTYVETNDTHLQLFRNSQNIPGNVDVSIFCQ